MNGQNLTTVHPDDVEKQLTSEQLDLLTAYHDALDRVLRRAMKHIDYNKLPNVTVSAIQARDGMVKARAKTAVTLNFTA